MANANVITVADVLFVPTLTPIGPFFGSGYQGAVTFDGAATILGLVPVANVYTMVQDISVSAMTVNSGVFINTGGFRIFCSGTLTNNGTIRNNGGAGGNAAGATAGIAGVLAGSNLVIANLGLARGP